MIESVRLEGFSGCLLFNLLIKSGLKLIQTRCLRTFYTCISKTFKDKDFKMSLENFLQCLIVLGDFFPSIKSEPPPLQIMTIATLIEHALQCSTCTLKNANVH